MSGVLTIPEEIKTLAQLERHLGIRLSDDADFFQEWSGELEPIAETDRQRLDQVRRNYLYQSNDGPLLEETIKLVMLSPILELAGFYQAPFKFRAEVSVAVETIGDDDEVLRGRIDGLVLLDRLWIVLIEAKKATLDLEVALPQALAYMAANPTAETDAQHPNFGMVTNGSSTIFVKLVGREYGVSDVFGTRSQARTNLYAVLQILKTLGRFPFREASAKAEAAPTPTIL
jgi:hypothetical protein